MLVEKFYQLKFHMKTPLGGRTLVCLNVLGHMTKIAATSIEGKKK